MLRTFDELGYRQEQRFHLELGLLKLVHVQRLIPIEDLLSQLGTPAPKAANAPASAISKPTSTSSASTVGGPTFASSAKVGVPSPMAAVKPAAPPAPSPFESDRTRKTPTATATQSPSAVPTTEGSLALAEAQPELAPQGRPHLVPPTPTPIPIIHFEPVDPPEIAAAEAPLPPTPAAVTGAYDIPALQQAIVTALAATKGQQSSSEQIEDAIFALNGDVLEIQTQVSINMLPIIINAEADRILKATLRQNNAGALKVKLLPGTPSAAPAKKSNRPATVGSAADLAAKHPIVQQAQQLFNAEISKVIDLRGKD